MPYTNVFKAKEAEYGKPMNKLLPELCTQYGVQGAADRLGVNRPTIYKWARRIGMQRKVCYIAK